MFERSRKFLEYAGLVSDARSLAALSAARLRSDGPPRRLRLRALAGGAVWCRPGASDFTVLYDAFHKRYHEPPPALGEPRTILDLGSNVGYTIAQMAERFPAARIVGVELDRDNVELCRRNIARFGPRCEVVWGAAWREDGEVVYAGPRQQSYSIVETGRRPGPAERAPAHSLPTLLARFEGGSVDFLKMDVEGAERQILATAGEWIGRVRCLKIETHAPYSVGDCIDDLARQGFEAAPDGSHAASVTAWNRRAGERAA